VQRHLDLRPIEARPPSTGYVLRKLIRRQRGRLTAAALVLVALVAGLVGTLQFAFAAQHNAGLLADKVREFDQLAGVVHLQRVRAGSRRLHPPWPENVAALRQWLDHEAGPLVQMLPVLGSTLLTLRARALPAAGDDAGAEDRNHLAAEAEQFLHGTLQELHDQLTRLAEREVPEVRKRPWWAERIGPLALHHPNARVSWAAAAAAVRRADGVTASARYRGGPSALPPQTGLVPIGMNPITKLWEFYDLRSAWDPATDRRSSDPADPDARRRRPHRGGARRRGVVRSGRLVGRREYTVRGCLSQFAANMPENPVGSECPINSSTSTVREVAVEPVSRLRRKLR
jgi:hypothetical protein